MTDLTGCPRPRRSFPASLLLVLAALLSGTTAALGKETAGTAGRARSHDSCRPGALPASGPEARHAGPDALVVCHVGGWGDVPLKHADDMMPIALGTKEYLETRGLRTRIIEYDRLPASPLARLVITAELWGLHSTGARRCARRLERVLGKHPDLGVVMVGLSNGAAFANSVMAELEDWTSDRVISVECGPPVYYVPVESDRILTIIRSGEDPLFSEEPDVVLSNTLGILVEMVVSLLNRSPLSFEAALRESGHEYPWPEIAVEVTGLIDRWLDGQTAFPARSPSDPK
ncbi:MAG: hypothetical protein JSU73_01915 [candidate division WOR-3 bacterium]|nr:MAG: hypothetical protein JSU73_01915 [candidate division WOR-3 bacterium]